MNRTLIVNYFVCIVAILESREC